MRNQDFGNQIMLTNTEGIVLKKVAYSSSSAIVTIYTKRFGQCPFMVRGLGKKGGKSASLQPLSRVEIDCTYREKNQVQTLSGISLKQDSHPLRHPLKGAISMFLAELLYKSLREESPDSELFDYLDSSIDFFEKDEYSPNFHLLFLVKLTKFFGFFPSGKWIFEKRYFDLLNGSFTGDEHASLHILDAREAAALYELTVSNFETKLQFDNVLRRNLLKTIVEYYQIHLEGLGEIKSLPVLIEIFSGHSENPT